MSFQKIKKKLLKWLNIYNPEVLDSFIREELQKLKPGSKIIDVGAGSQRYRKYCQHLQYFSQDFGKARDGIGSETFEYHYGSIDFKGNCWEIDTQGDTFDAVLCTEVLEHVPYPAETIKEISRILKPGGRLILTAPLTSLRHMDPHWYQPGLSDNWYHYFFDKFGIAPIKISSTGCYKTLLMSELMRVISFDRKASIFLLPSLIYMRVFLRRLPGELSGVGYQVVGEKR